MKVDYCLILAAGHGTRMGDLGKKLPKPLWPIFDKTLLELQIAVAKKYGAEKIYINTHHLANEIESFVKNNNLDVTLLNEHELLGSGGAIHNLAVREEVNYQGNLLIINSDQFYFHDSEFSKTLFADSPFDTRLVGISMTPENKYNALEIKNNNLVDINKSKEHKKDFITYSGISLINLESLNRVEGFSNFFESVANYKSNTVEVHNPKVQEYWDFGTLELYKENIQKILLDKDTDKTSNIYPFLKEHVSICDKASLLEIEGEDVFLVINGQRTKI